MPNFVNTYFNLSFKLAGRAGRRKMFLCPSEESLERAVPLNTCIWNLATNPPYRQPYDFYNFNMSVKNVLGSADFIYKFHHFGHGNISSHL